MNDNFPTTRMAVLGALCASIACAAQPSTEEHRVWLAAARYVYANEAAGTKNPGPLPVLASTSFPKLPESVAQLKQRAKKEFCDVPATEAEALVVQLQQLNASSESVRDAFNGLPDFRLTKKRPRKGDHLGISKVLFSPDRRTAFLNLDIGGVSGSIVRMKLENGEWGGFEECTQWTSY